MTATEHIDPLKKGPDGKPLVIGRLLTAGWRVERTHPFDGGTWLTGVRDARGEWAARKVPHGELVEVVIEDTPTDDVTGDVRQAVQ